MSVIGQYQFINYIKASGSLMNEPYPFQSQMTDSLGIILHMVNEHHYQNIFRIHFIIMEKIMIQPDKKFAHAMTAQLPWHVQNFDLMWSLFSM